MNDGATGLSAALEGAASSPDVGILEWFWKGDREVALAAIEDMRALGVRHLRFGFSWADFECEDGPAWYDWLVPQLARHFELLPCFLYTPPSLGEVPGTASPPRELKGYADFLDICITRYGEHFEYVELWNEANNLIEWNFGLDRSWTKFCEMVGNAAHWARQRGKKTVLGGMAPIDPQWLETMFENGLMPLIDVVGVHGFPGSYDLPGAPWRERIEAVAQVLKRHDHPAPIWLTETGYSTWRHDDFGQLRLLDDAEALPVERIYLLSLRDLAAHRPSQTGHHNDERDYHFGLQTETGAPKLLYRLWAEHGLAGAREAARWPTPLRTDQPVTLVTGGAGFVGCNLSDRLASDGRRVRVIDNLSRAGAEQNLRWLRERHGELIEFAAIDLRDRHALYQAMGGVEQIFHFAGQVAVTTSLENPLDDFAINLGGTINLLEAARRQSRVPGIIFASTNKVYGGLEDIELSVQAGQYQPVDDEVRARGISEQRPLDFHSPYGCSKGGADQYVVDYARCMGVPSVVFRMSCIYGQRQFGTEDQGWVAHFLIQALRGRPITLYGDGMQVRDILHVSDLVDAYLHAEANLPRLSGQAFNLGGGPGNTISLLQLLEWIDELHGSVPKVERATWRPGDQRYYVSDTRRFQETTGWQPRMAARDGVADLYRWLARRHGAAGNATARRDEEEIACPSSAS